MTLALSSSQVEEAKAAEAREKERRLREYQLLRVEREKWELQGVGSSIAREAIETAINRLLTACLYRISFYFMFAAFVDFL